MPQLSNSKLEKTLTGLVDERGATEVGLPADEMALATDCETADAPEAAPEAPPEL